MADATFPVQSLHPPSALPVAVDVRSVTGANSAAVQWIGIVDRFANRLASVGSYGGANPVYTAIVDAAGSHVLVHSVHVANVPSVVASLIGSPSVVASVIGQPTVTASVPGQLTSTVSVAGIPTFQIGSGTAQVGYIGSGNQPLGTVVASVIGQPTSTVSVAGTPSVVASVIGQPTVTASVIGIPTVVGSQHVTQADTATPFTVIVASTVGGGSTVTGSVQVTQANTATPFTVIVASTVGGGSAVTLAQSLFVFEGSSPWITTGSQHVTQANTAEPFTVIVASTVGGGAAVTLAQSLTVFQGLPPWTTVTSVIGQPTVTASVIGTPSIVASVIGQPTTTVSVAGVPSVVASVIGQPTVTASLVGNPGVSQSGSYHVTVPSLAVGQAGAPWSVVGSQYVSGTIPVGSIYTSSAIQPVPLAGLGVPIGTAPTATISGTLTRIVTDDAGRFRVVIDQGSIGAAVGSLHATIAGSAHITGTVVASVIGVPSVVASVIGQPTVTASVIGVPTTVASVIGAPTIVASVIGVPTFVGSTRVTQANTAEPFTVIVASTIGGGAAVTIAQSLSVFQGLPPWTTVGSQTVTQANTAEPFTVIVASTIGGGAAVTVAQSLFVFQGLAPWTTVTSVIGQPTTTTSLIGVPTVVASVIGQPTVTASVVGVPTFQIASGTAQIGFIGSGNQPLGTVVASVIGTPNVTATQGGSYFVSVLSQAVFQANTPWLVQPTSTGVFQGFAVASIIGVPTAQIASGTAQLGFIGSGNQPLGTVVGCAWVANTPSVVIAGSLQVRPFNAGFMGQRIIVAASATLVSSSTISGQRARIEFYNRGVPSNTDSSAIVYLAGSINVASNFTVWPLEYGAKLTLEAGPGIAFYACTIGSHASNINSGQEVAMYELA